MPGLYLRLTRGDRLRAKKNVMACVGETFSYGNGRVGLSQKPVTIAQGKIVTFLADERGYGADAAYQARLRLEDGEEVAVATGWGSLRSDQFEKVAGDS